MLMGSMIGIHQQAGVVMAYVATPAPDVICHGAIIVLHDIWGSTDHIKGVADRFAALGYYVLAPDVLFTSDEKRARASEMQKNLLSAEPDVRNEAVRKLRTLLMSTQTPQFASLT